MCVVFVNLHEWRSFLKISPLFSSQILHKKIHIFFLSFFSSKRKKKKKKK